MSKAKKADLRDFHYDVLKSPVITEKSTAASEHGKFVFNVCSTASKKDIRQAVEGLFKVKVVKINTLNRKGKTKLFRGVKGKQSDTKKAMITLAEGQSIDLQTGVK